MICTFKKIHAVGYFVLNIMPFTRLYSLGEKMFTVVNCFLSSKFRRFVSDSSEEGVNYRVANAMASEAYGDPKVLKFVMYFFFK